MITNFVKLPFDGNTTGYLHYEDKAELASLPATRIIPDSSKKGIDTFSLTHIWSNFVFL